MSEQTPRSELEFIQRRGLLNNETSENTIDYSNFPDGYILYAMSFTNATKDDVARIVRNNLLISTDRRMVTDAPWDTTAWATYRQQLRDLPADPAWPDMQFPMPPEA